MKGGEIDICSVSGFKSGWWVDAEEHRAFHAGWGLCFVVTPELLLYVVSCFRTLEIR